MAKRVQLEIFQLDEIKDKPFAIDLYLAIEKSFNRDWNNIWDEFEITGNQIYCSIEFRGKIYIVWDADLSSILINHYPVMQWAESDTCNKAMTEKILRNIKNFIIENRYQYKNKT